MTRRVTARRFSVCWLLGLLLVASAPGRAQPGAHPPADTARWVDNDDTPWLRGIRRVPMSHERSLPYWQAQVLAHPAPDLGRVVLLDRVAGVQDELGV